MIRAAVILGCLLAPIIAEAQVSEPDDYRMDHFRAPVPDTLAGAKVVEAEAAFELWQAGDVAFVDVLPRAPKPKNLPEGTIWRQKPRHSIPGALWLPNVGYGAIAEITHDYFRQGLIKATENNKNHPVLFFCLEDCWMSWNAAKRALEYGYETVYWMPDGTDGWTFFDFPTETVEPEPAP